MPHRTHRAAAAVLCGIISLTFAESLAHAQGGDDGGLAGGSCPADINDSSIVDVNDLLAVITAWGACPAPCPPICAADVDDNCAVDVNDLLAVVTSWGPCPCPGDGAEPNQTCATAPTLLPVTGNGAGTPGTPWFYSNYSVAPAGDVDHYRFFAAEDCSICADFLEVKVSLSVPSTAGSSYTMVLRRINCGASGVNIQSLPAIAPGTTGTITMWWNDNWGSDDGSWMYVEIRQNAPQVAHCQPYTLSYFLTEH
jgi:hypothetical protein